MTKRTRSRSGLGSTPARPRRPARISPAPGGGRVAHGEHGATHVDLDATKLAAPAREAIAELLRFPERRYGHGMDVRLVKSDRSRRYWIRPGRTRDEWYCQVWFGEQTQHRGCITTDMVLMHRIKGEYLREIAELEQDGWTRAAPGPSSKSTGG